MKYGKHLEYCVFSIPGWDTTIGYNSFNRYKFECWDIGKECHQITSDYDYPKLTRISITYDKSNRLLTMYQDGKEVGNKTISRKLLDTKKEKFYIGIPSVCMFMLKVVKIMREKYAILTEEKVATSFFCRLKVC